MFFNPRIDCFKMPEITEQDVLRFQMQQASQQQASDPSALYADIMREEKVTNIIAQISPENLLEEIEHRIRGEKRDVFSKQWESINPHGVQISEELVANFMSFLGSILNQNTSLSNFSVKEINNLMEIVIEWVKNDLTDNDERYKIVGKYTEMDRVGHIICMTCFTVFKRAQNGMEARNMWRALKVQESLSTAPQKKGMMDALKFWKSS